MPDIKRTAEISACGKYRYSLTRTWDKRLPVVVFIGLNPSTADAESDDPTIRKCIGFAIRWGYGGLVMLNLFAYRATNPADMKRAYEPVGPDNSATMFRFTLEHDVVACWGAHGSYERRDSVAMLCDIVSRPKCLGTTKDGHPKHPLYLPYATPLEPYRKRL